MAPRHERTPLLANAHMRSTRVGSSSTSHTPFANPRAIDLIRKSISGELSTIPYRKQPQHLVCHNKRKVAFNLKYAITEQKTSPLTQREEIMAQEHEAMLWKLKRLEVQAHAREMKRTLHKQNKEIRRKRRELRRLKAVERELRQFLEQCESQSQELSTTSASLAFRSNLNRIYMLAAALLSFLLVRIFSYSHLV